MSTEIRVSYKTGSNSNYQQHESSTSDENSKKRLKNTPKKQKHCTIFIPPKLLNFHKPEKNEVLYQACIFHQFAFSQKDFY